MMLRIEDIPNTNSKWEDLIEFIYSFKAARYWGSFEKMVEVAEKVKNKDIYDEFSIEELRTFLCFIQRSHRHMCSVPDEKEMKKIHCIIEVLRMKV